ncbi:hypothetical protein [Pedobacter nutrimenti]|nr:hypothetical protein [Pedobacter nutrimenti]
MKIHYFDPLIEIICPYVNMNELAPKGLGNTEELFDEPYLNAGSYPFLTA